MAPDISREPLHVYENGLNLLISEYKARNYVEMKASNEPSVIQALLNPVKKIETFETKEIGISTFTENTIKKPKD